MIDQELLDILVCPLGKAPVELIDGAKLVCSKCGLTYRIEDDIPIMLIEEAELPEGVSKIEELACYPKNK